MSLNKLVSAITLTIRYVGTNSIGFRLLDSSCLFPCYANSIEFKSIKFFSEILAHPEITLCSECVRTTYVHQKLLTLFLSLTKNGEKDLSPIFNYTCDQTWKGKRLHV